MKRLFLIVPLIALLSACTTAPVPQAVPAVSGPVELNFGMQATWRCLVQLPKGYEQGDREWPLVVFLHGSGERGSDLQKVAVHGPPKLVAQGREFPFILVSPQCPEGLWWYAPQIDAFVAQLIKSYRVDAKRVYLTGLSMGGFGTWDAAAFNPGRYAAIVPVCGGGEYDPTVVGQRLKDMPVWAFHGAKDAVVSPSYSKERVDAINLAGGHAKLMIYLEAGHDSWTETYANPALYDWLLSQKRP